MYRVTRYLLSYSKALAPTGQNRPSEVGRLKEDELKQLKSEVAALERKIQLELAPPKLEVVQEQQTDGGTAQTQSPPTGERATTEPPSDMSNQSQFIREHVQIVRPMEANSTVKGIKM